ncbi:SDR family NAD(P)-dependent oxidoreductase [Yinghuangia aomiensis]
MGRLEGRTALITGAGEGIGRAFAKRFAAEGAAVVVAERHVETGEAVTHAIRNAGGRSEFVRTDVTNSDDLLGAVHRAQTQFGGVDILVSNAGGDGRVRRLENKDSDEFQHHHDLQVGAAFRLMKACFPHMKANGWGRIINVASLNGVNAHMYTADFNAGKEGLRALTRTAAREWAPYGITANVICPGAATAAFHRFAEQYPEMAAEAGKANPMGRIGDVDDDIAPVGLFLASDDSRYMTGNTVFLDGGAHINGVAWAIEPEAE